MFRLRELFSNCYHYVIVVSFTALFSFGYQSLSLLFEYKLNSFPIYQFLFTLLLTGNLPHTSFFYDPVLIRNDVCISKIVFDSRIDYWKELVFYAVMLVHCVRIRWLVLRI